MEHEMRYDRLGNIVCPQCGAAMREYALKETSQGDMWVYSCERFPSGRGCGSNWYRNEDLRISRV